MTTFWCYFFHGYSYGSIGIKMGLGYILGIFLQIHLVTLGQRVGKLKLQKICRVFAFQIEAL
jgi:hypothetical protein